jgi:hypothetical protein
LITVAALRINRPVMKILMRTFAIMGYLTKQLAGEDVDYVNDSLVRRTEPTTSAAGTG